MTCCSSSSFLLSQIRTPTCSMLALSIFLVLYGVERAFSGGAAAFVQPSLRFPDPSSSCLQLQPVSSIRLLESPLQRKFSVSTSAKRKGASGGASTSASKKVQVKLLKYVAGIGQKGDVVRVSPSVLNNVLRPAGAAQVITDEEVKQELADAAAREREVDRTASQLKKEIEEATITITRKAGPDGKLFGGIGPKAIIDELKSNIGSSASFLDSKGVKITSLVDAKGDTVRGDIKSVGPFGATIALTKDISAKLRGEVCAES